MTQGAASDGINTPEFFARLADADLDAVEALFRRFAGEMMDYLARTRRRHGLREHEYEDAVQATFVKLLRKPLELNPGRPIGPLLMTIVLNTARDVAKAKRIRKANETAAQTEQWRTAAGAEAVDARLLAVENRVLVESKMRLMSPADQIALRVFMESGAEGHVAMLAEATGITRGAAQMRSLRARTRLAELLEEDGKARGTR